MDEFIIEYSNRKRFGVFYLTIIGAELLCGVSSELYSNLKMKQRNKRILSITVSGVLFKMCVS